MADIEKLAGDIKKVAEAFEKIFNQGVSKEAIVALLRDMPTTKHMAKRELMAVLDNLDGLYAKYVNKDKHESVEDLAKLRK